MDNRSNEQVLHDFERVRASTPYREIEEQRKKLPAWEYRRQIVDAVDKNPVVIMVGETGEFISRAYNSFD
jgi:HrpA-like RNA helicase